MLPLQPRRLCALASDADEDHGPRRLERGGHVGVPVPVRRRVVRHDDRLRRNEQTVLSLAMLNDVDLATHSLLKGGEGRNRCVVHWHGAAKRSSGATGVLSTDMGQKSANRWFVH